MYGIHNRLPVAVDGLPFILIPLAGALGLALAGVAWAAICLGLFGGFSAWFFRDPERTPPPNERAVLSPADGTVIRIEEVDEDRFLNARVKKISIFMSIFNVHVNRSPITGRVEAEAYFPGRFLAAHLDKASLENEHNALILEAPGMARILVVQIAGLVARRIVCWVRPGDPVVRGRRFGLIRFGSRLDVYMPLEASVEVRLRQKVKAGESILGCLP
ncbi:MAG: phosphatidylserine decarboxylase family protein [Proteobacteria bacterium]|nr:phosphatidylserine decarboxylase family protein [Pseudomonadota bacterium]